MSRSSNWRKIERMNTPDITLYGIPNCDTVKKARAWLAQQGANVRFHDFRKDGVPAGELPLWLARLGSQTLLNRRGTTWRKLDAETQANAQNEAGAAALMLAQPSVIKRPVVQWGADAAAPLTVGFDEAAFARALAGDPANPVR